MIANFYIQKIFKNVITWEEFLKLNIEDKQSLYLCKYTFYPHFSELLIEEFERKTDYPLRSYFMDCIFDVCNLKKTTLQTFERNFDNLLNEIDYLDIKDIEQVNKKFILIHWRIVEESQPGHILKNKNSILSRIISVLENKYNLIIFSKKRIPNITNNILQISNLAIYASIMHHENCEVLISEWSGGGQLSQYCHTKKVFYYFDHYKECNYCELKKTLENKAKSNLYDGFDFRKTTDIELFLFKDIDNLLEHLVLHNF